MKKINFVAEVGVNHEGSLDSALEHVRAAAKFGATAVKFQAYSAERLASRNSPSYWDTSQEPETSQFKLFSRYDKFEEGDYSIIADLCKELNVEFMVTCFDTVWLEKLDKYVKIHKIASADITNFRLQSAVAACNKKILLSTGAATLTEVKIAVDNLQASGALDIVLMHCVLCYPTNLEDASLGRMINLRQIADQFGLTDLGYSDHTKPTKNHEVLIAAIGLGATWIEKHFSMSPEMQGNDHYHSFGPNQLENFMSIAGDLPTIISWSEENFLDIQKSARANARRGLYATRDLEVGRVINGDDLIELRPVAGIPSENISNVIGATVRNSIKQGEPLFFDSVNGSQIESI